VTPGGSRRAAHIPHDVHQPGGPLSSKCSDPPGAVRFRIRLRATAVRVPHELGGHPAAVRVRVPHEPGGHPAAPQHSEQMRGGVGVGGPGGPGSAATTGYPNAVRPFSDTVTAPRGGCGDISARGQTAPMCSSPTSAQAASVAAGSRPAAAVAVLPPPPPSAMPAGSPRVTGHTSAGCLGGQQPEPRAASSSGPTGCGSPPGPASFRQVDAAPAFRGCTAPGETHPGRQRSGGAREQDGSQEGMQLQRGHSIGRPPEQSYCQDGPSPSWRSWSRSPGRRGRSPGSWSRSPGRRNRSPGRGNRSCDGTSVYSSRKWGREGPEGRGGSARKGGGGLTCAGSRSPRWGWRRSRSRSPRGREEPTRRSGVPSRAYYGVTPQGLRDDAGGSGTRQRQDDRPVGAPGPPPLSHGPRAVRSPQASCRGPDLAQGRHAPAYPPHHQDLTWPAPVTGSPPAIYARVRNQPGTPQAGRAPYHDFGARTPQSDAAASAAATAAGGCVPSQPAAGAVPHPRASPASLPPHLQRPVQPAPSVMAASEGAAERGLRQMGAW
jgi:hypothetical protein